MTRSFQLCLALSLALVLAASLVSAASFDRRTDDRRPRNVTIAHDDPHQVNFTSTLREGEKKNRIDFQMGAQDDGIRFHARYSADDASPEVIGLSVRLDNLIEYAENGVAPGFQRDSDTVLNRLRLRNWGVVQQSAPDANGTITLTVSTTVQGAVVTFRAFLVQVPVALRADGNQSFILTPNSFKFNVELDLTNYVYNTSNSLLALRVKVESPRHHELNDDRGHSGHEAGEDNHSIGHASVGRVLFSGGSDDNSTSGHGSDDGGSGSGSGSGGHGSDDAGSGVEPEDHNHGADDNSTLGDASHSDAIEVGDLADPTSIRAVVNWLPVATVDGQVVNVISSAVAPSCDDTGNEAFCNQFFLSFNATNPTTVVYDPSVAIATQYVDSNTGLNVPPSASAASSVATVSASFLLALLSVMAVWGF